MTRVHSSEDALIPTAQDAGGSSLGKFCDACQAHPRYGFCSLPGCPEVPPAPDLVREIGRLRTALKAIHDATDDEIAVRFRTGNKSEAEMGRNSRIYSMLVVPRNMARNALAAVPS